MDFKGIQIIAPEHEVTLHKTGRTMYVRCMNNAEEIALRTSLITKKLSMDRMINDIVFNCLVNPGMSKEQFFLETADSDKEILLYAIYLVSYYKNEKVDWVCQNNDCGMKYTVDVDLTEAYQPGETLKLKKWNDYLKKTVDFKHDNIPNTTLVLGDVTIKDVLNCDSVIRNGSQDDVDSYLPYIKSIKTLDIESGDPIETADKYDIMMVYKQLPTFIKDKFIETINENFTKYDPSFFHEHECPHCGHKNKIFLNITERFFRMVLKLKVD